MSSGSDEAGPSSSAPGAVDTSTVKRRRHRNSRPILQVINATDRVEDPDNGSILFVPTSHMLIGLPIHEREENLTIRGHKRELKNDVQIEGRLQKLGLIHMSKVPNANLDVSLLKALIEFWRPETHTFHFPIGEMTVTAEDVAFLYGLRTEGTPVTGSTSGTDWDEKVQRLLCPNTPLRNWARQNRTDCHMMRLNWLHGEFKNGPLLGASEEDLDRYTRAMCLDMFGTLMFPDASHNCVPAYYLDLMEGDLNEERNINWGGAVLACLYRALDRAAMLFKKPAGPWLLLLYWAWSYLPICRPGVGEVTGLGQPDLDSCPPFAWKWSHARTFVRSNHRGTVQFARDSLVLMEVDDVNWQPYLEFLTLMPRHAQEGSLSFYLRLPCIHYYIIGWTFPDRCRHQSGLVQAFPPPLPIAWITMNSLYSFCHGSFRGGTDWRIVFAPLIAMWDQEALQRRAESVDQRQWSNVDARKYARYMREIGGSELPVTRDEATARRAHRPVSQRQYAPVAPKVQGQGKIALANAVEAISLLAMKGCRRIGKKILRNCESQLRAASMPYQLEDLLENKGFPTNIDEIVDSDTEISPPRANIPEIIQPEDSVQHEDEEGQGDYMQEDEGGQWDNEGQEIQQADDGDNDKGQEGQKDERDDPYACLAHRRKKRAIRKVYRLTLSGRK
ncbi:hypothetical protein LUZ61_009837 [Rhynchospora tenuis]|uniref:Aminotransferase-like plant mobile domain-containing protein n=1 Tax=Rhynchospora tenuis TaxID=198213 RepID=A0AAD5ZY58_9POAL|nr:hypothetical protein LUZ61_009837 [Rhynchospora tenuis]